MAKDIKGTPKALALLLMAKKHPDMKSTETMPEDNMPEDMPNEGTANPDLVDAAHDIIVALDTKNEEGLASALEDFVSLCEKNGPAVESAPSEPEGPPEVEGG